MKKRKKLSKLNIILPKNSVAKFAARFNKAQVFKDRTKYQRKAKHKNKESFPARLINFFGKGFFEENMIA